MPKNMGTWGGLLLVGTVLAAGCGGMDDRGGDVLVPNLSAVAWRNQAKPDDQFFFQVDETGVRASSFSGNENDEGAQLSFTGSFTDRAITFTYNADAGAKAALGYTGTIEGDSAKITLSGSAGQLVLTR